MSWKLFPLLFLIAIFIPTIMGQGTTVDDRDPGIQYTKGWRDPPGFFKPFLGNFNAGTMKATNSKGDTATFRFNGKQIIFFTYRRIITPFFKAPKS